MENSPNQSERVVILGASDQPERYAYRAFAMLQEHGHTPIPVHPTLNEVEGVPVVAALSEVEKPVDTLTLYVNPSISEGISDDIVALRPGRVIFNPGTESAVLSERLTNAGLPCEDACTLVLLSTGQD